ncbi:MAG: ATP-binding protein, partial [Sulfobacillus sp.]|nr:ATP-binding protein [Sulfobacillus sp.]
MNRNPNEFQRRDQSLVGRTHEREWVWRWLSDPRPETMWIVVTGPAGLGKSTFLQWLASIRRPDLRVVWLDARITGKTPVDV